MKAIQILGRVSSVLMMTSGVFFFSMALMAGLGAIAFKAAIVVLIGFATMYAVIRSEA